MEMIIVNKGIEIKKLIKRYDSNFQLGELSLDIPAGEIIGLIGENGAGKTTLIKSILDILKINKGEIKIFGKDVKNNETLIKEDIGVVLDNSFFPEVLGQSFSMVDNLSCYLPQLASNQTVHHLLQCIASYKECHSLPSVFLL